MKLALILVLLTGAVRAEHVAEGGAAPVSIASGELIYVATPFPNGINGQMVVRRLALDGGVIWDLSWGRGQGEEPTSIATTPDGGVIIAGARKRGCFIVRFDAQGRQVWEANPVSTGLCRPAGVVTDGDGNVYLLATIDGRAGYDAMVWKLGRRGGDTVWTYRRDSNESLYAQNLYLDPRGDRLRAFVLRKRGTDFLEEFFRLDLSGRLL